jgi:hypothetical protein
LRCLNLLLRHLDVRLDKHLLLLLVESLKHPSVLPESHQLLPRVTQLFTGRATLDQQRSLYRVLLDSVGCVFMANPQKQACRDAVLGAVLDMLPALGHDPVQQLHVVLLTGLLDMLECELIKAEELPFGRSVLARLGRELACFLSQKVSLGGPEGFIFCEQKYSLRAETCLRLFRMLGTECADESLEQLLGWYLVNNDQEAFSRPYNLPIFQVLQSLLAQQQQFFGRVAEQDMARFVEVFFRAITSFKDAQGLLSSRVFKGAAQLRAKVVLGEPGLEVYMDRIYPECLKAFQTQYESTQPEHLEEVDLTGTVTFKDHEVDK